MDLYGTLLSSRLYIPTDVTKLDPRHLSLHLYRRNLDNGALPLPIFSAIQHGAWDIATLLDMLWRVPSNCSLTGGRLVTPLEKAEVIKEVADEKALSIRNQRSRSLDSEQARLEQDIRWLWYEFTPYEVGCDEIGGRWFAPYTDMTTN